MEKVNLQMVESYRDETSLGHKWKWVPKNGMLEGRSTKRLFSALKDPAIVEQHIGRGGASQQKYDKLCGEGRGEKRDQREEDIPSEQFRDVDPGIPRETKSNRPKSVEGRGVERGGEEAKSRWEGWGSGGSKGGKGRAILGGQGTRKKEARRAGECDCIGKDRVFHSQDDFLEGSWISKELGRYLNE